MGSFQQSFHPLQQKLIGSVEDVMGNLKLEFVNVKKMIIVVLIVREKNFFQATIVLRANISNLLSHSAIIIPVNW